MFLILSQNDIISATLAEKLATMAKFRNLLGHRYAKIDTAQLFHILQNDVPDIKQFMQEISHYLAKTSDT